MWPDKTGALVCACGFDLGEAWSQKFKPLPENDVDLDSKDDILESSATAGNDEGTNHESEQKMGAP